MDQVQKFLSILYEGIGSTRAKRLSQVALSESWRELLELSMPHPSSYRWSTPFLKDALAVNIVRKLAIPENSENCRKAAVEKFWASEAQCFHTNRRIYPFVDNCHSVAPPTALEDFILRWKKEVRLVLGACPTRLTPRFSGGSTLSDKGALTTIPDKISTTHTVYPRAIKHVRLAVDATPLASSYWLADVVTANRFETVRKDSWTDRGICIEASQPIALQLDVGRLLKARYRKRYGVDLRHAPELHRALAKSASLTGSHATIDLSNASDTLSRALVELLLPKRWFMLLDSLRAPLTEIDGKKVRLEKFSSMGNGFTFELETIVFRTLCEVICQHQGEILVFGDDIIVPQKDATAVIAALSWAGFTPNPKKTFVEGPFRESCGGDFFLGQAVRPYFMKEIPAGPVDWIKIANGLRRVDPDGRWTKRAWRFAVNQVPKKFRVFGPEHLGDIVICDPSAEPSWRPWVSTMTRLTADGKRVTTRSKHDPIPFWRVITPIIPRYRVDEHFSGVTTLAAALVGSGEHVQPRKVVRGFRLRWVPAWGLNT